MFLHIEVILEILSFKLFLGEDGEWDVCKLTSMEDIEKKFSNLIINVVNQNKWWLV